MIRDAAAHSRVLTVEDGIRDGGIGAAIADQVHAISPEVHVETLGVPTQFVPHGKPDAILTRLGLDANGITATAQRLLA
jgi:1-deoxy-D-xylulose-5-phosphate synthase